MYLFAEIPDGWKERHSMNNERNIIGIAALIVALLLLLPSVNAKDKQGPGDGMPNLKYIAEFEDGILYKAGDFNVVELHGNYHQMGRQYGKLLKEDLAKLYDEAVGKSLIKREGLTFEKMIVHARSVFETYPQRFKAILHGMSETSEIEVDKLILLDQIVSSHSTEDSHISSFIAAWGEYTSGKPLIVGRNWGLTRSFSDYAPYLTVAIYNPDDASIPAASIGYVGQVSTFTAINEAGLMIAMNEWIISGGRVSFQNRISSPVLSMAFLFDSFTTKQLDAAVNTARSSIPFIVNVADRNGACSYEWPTFGIRKRDGDTRGLLVATNHFVDPSWGMVEQRGAAAGQSALRWNNLRSLAANYKGSFEPSVMMTVMDTPVEKGGADGDGKTGTTAYQIIAVPEQLKIWLKAPAFQDWTEIDLSVLFRN
jgi:hypothetical protein